MFVKKIALLLLLAAVTACSKNQSAAVSTTVVGVKKRKFKVDIDHGVAELKKQRDRDVARARDTLATRNRLGLAKKDMPQRFGIAGPVCDGIGHFVATPGAKCIDGSDTGWTYFCQDAGHIPAGANGPLLISVEGGGACGSPDNGSGFGGPGDQCDCAPTGTDGFCTGHGGGTFTHSRWNAVDNIDSGVAWADSEFGADQPGIYHGATSPYNQDYNIVRLAYCTADVHWGNAAPHTYTTTLRNTQQACAVNADCLPPLVGAPSGHCSGGFCTNVTYTVTQKGYNNIGLMLPQIAALFPTPAKISIFGGSAGGAGVDANLDRFRNTWPSTNMYSMSDAIAPFYASFVPGGTALWHSWGAWAANAFRGVSYSTLPIADSIILANTLNGAGQNKKYVYDHVPSVRRGYLQCLQDSSMQAYEYINGGDFGTAPGPDILAMLAGLFNGGVSVSTNGRTTYASTKDTANDTANYTITNIPLAAGQTLDIGTCGVAGSSFVGDTFIRLFDPTGANVASSNNACAGLGSRITFAVPGGGPAGQYTLRQGCSSSSACSGVVTWTVTGSTPKNASYNKLPAYSATNTANDTANYVAQKIYLREDQTIDLGTCGVAGSNMGGNTFLRLFDPTGAPVANNDNACGDGGSRLQYTVGGGGLRGAYELRQGCSAATSCSGTTTYWIIGPTEYKFLIPNLTCHTEVELPCRTSGCDPCNDPRMTCGIDTTVPGPGCPANCLPECNYESVSVGGILLKDWIRGWMEVPGFTASWQNRQP